MSKTKSLFADVQNLKELRSLVKEVRQDDGVDPRLEARGRKRSANNARLGRSHGEHRHEQFLAQIQTVIDGALCAAADPILNSLAVREVIQDRGSYLVVVEPRFPDEPLDIQAATQALERASSMLTREVAAEITRKEVPHLKYIVLPAGASKVDE